MGSKMFVYATGDRRSVAWQVREGLAQVLFNQTMYETDWSQAIRSGSVVQSPRWMSDGLARYAARGLDATSQETILDLCRRDAFRQLELASGLDAALLGQAMWSYVADIYGLPTVANVLYMTRVTQSVESGFRLATGSFLQDLALDVQAHHLRQAPEGYAALFPPFQDRKAMRKAGRSLGPSMPMRPVSRLAYTQFLPNPEGNLAAFTTDERGQLRVGTVDLDSGARTWHATLGHRLDRLDNELHPRLAWGPQGQLLFFSVDLKGAPTWASSIWARGSGPERAVPNRPSARHGVLPRREVLAHVRPPTRPERPLPLRHRGEQPHPAWRDRFDDLQPAFWPGSSTFMFSSNRPDDTLRNDRLDHPYPEALDLYVGDLADDPITLTRWTATPAWTSAIPTARGLGIPDGDHRRRRRAGWGLAGGTAPLWPSTPSCATAPSPNSEMPCPCLWPGTCPSWAETSPTSWPPGGRTQWTEVAMPDLSALHAAPSMRRSPPPPCPFPQNCPHGNNLGRGRNQLPSLRL